MAQALPVKPVSKGGWRRRLKWIFLAGLLLVLGVVASLDFWAPALAARQAGVTYSRSETLPGRIVTWRGVQWSAGNVKLDASHAVVSSPWRVFFRSQADLQVNGWVIAIDPVEDAPARKVRNGGAWGELIPALRTTGQTLERWVGEASFTEGRIRVAGERISVSRLSVQGGTLTGVAKIHGQNLEFTVGLLSGLVQVNWPETRLSASCRVISDGVSGLLRWEDNTAKLSGSFENGKWLPQTLLVEGKDWRVPAARLGLANLYEDLHGDVAIRRKGDGVEVTLAGTAQPLARGLPVASYELGFDASMERVRLEKLKIVSSHLLARLSSPLEWRVGQGWRSEGEPVFNWSADLATVTAGVVTGRAQGEAKWATGPDQAWRVLWSASLEDAAWRGWSGVRAEFQGATDADSTLLDEVRITLPDGSYLAGGARYLHAEGWTFEDATLRGEVGAEVLRPWLPAGLPPALRLGRVEFSARGGGRWPAIAYEGEATLAPTDWAGWAAESIVLQAKGRATVLEKLELTAARGDARIRATGAGDLRLGLGGEVALLRGDGRELAPAGLSEIRWGGGPLSAHLRLGGADSTKLRLEWAQGGDFSIGIGNIDTKWADDWRAGPAWPDATVREFAVDGSTGADGEVGAEGRFDLSWRPSSLPEVRLHGTGRATGRGFVFGPTTAELGGETMATGAGTVPWRFIGRRQGRFEPIEDGEWALRVDTRPDSAQWNTLAAVAGLKGVEIDGPGLALGLSGATRAPRLDGAMAIARLGLRGEGLPRGGLELRALRFETTATREVVAVRNFSTEIDRQRVEAEGRLLFGGDDWAKLRASPFVWVRDNAEAWFRLREASVAALVHYAPTWFAPKGEISADLRLTPGQNLHGTVSLHGVATRPLGSFGVLHQIDMDLAFDGMDVRIVRMQALAGGQPVSVSGGVRRVPDAMPALDLMVKAERFPLFRMPSLLLRGDLDLTIKTVAENRTRLGGEVRLRDSLFLADIRPLLTPSRESAAEVRGRPPFFSVETPPLADWELGLRLTGDRFLRMRTPIFEGVGSADFELAGTLLEPRATGGFWVERGNILFPFASFAVQEGGVFLRVNDPFTPVLDFSATARRLGYDLRLQLRGTADAPQVILSSSPPLSAENLMLMVTTGKAPTENQGSASSTQRLAAMGVYIGRDLLRSIGIGGSNEERFSLVAGEKISRQGRETYGFEYRLGDKWSLTGEYDEFDAYNAGIKRHFGPSPQGAAVKRPVIPESTDAR